MAHVSRAKPAAREQEDHQVGAKKARAARLETAGRLTEMIVEGDMTGSPQYLARRLREVRDAQEHNDQLMLRGALMEVAAAAAFWAVDIEISGPPDPWAS